MSLNDISYIITPASMSIDVVIAVEIFWFVAFCEAFLSV